MRVSVIGGSEVDRETRETAAAVGRTLGDRGHTVVCGGLSGVMRAACRGAREADAETIGVLPTADRADANRFVTTPIATGMGHARNALVVLNGDCAVAIDGGSPRSVSPGRTTDRSPASTPSPTTPRTRRRRTV